VDDTLKKGRNPQYIEVNSTILNDEKNLSYVYRKKASISGNNRKQPLGIMKKREEPGRRAEEGRKELERKQQMPTKQKIRVLPPRMHWKRTKRKGAGV